MQSSTNLQNQLQPQIKSLNNGGVSVSVIILSVVLFLTMLALIGFIIYYFVTRSKKAISSSSSSKESRVGPVYVSSSLEVSSLLEQVNKIIALSQKNACAAENKNELDLMQSQVLDEFFTSPYGAMSCADIKSGALSMKSALAESGKVPENILNETDVLFQMLMKNSCGVDGKIDKEKLKTLLTQFIKAFC
jgi:hypothetical protein